jgi:hypothetical protein
MKNPGIPIKEAIEIDPSLQDVVDMIESGEFSPSSGPKDVEWSEEDKDRLNVALGKAFGWK